MTGTSVSDVATSTRMLVQSTLGSIGNSIKYHFMMQINHNNYSRNCGGHFKVAIVEKINDMASENFGTDNDGKNVGGNVGDEGYGEGHNGGDSKGRNERDNREHCEDNGENRQEIQPASDLYVSRLICNATVNNKHPSQHATSNSMQGSDNENPEPQEDEGTQFLCRILVICTTLKSIFLSQGKFIILFLLGDCMLGWSREPSYWC